MKKNFRMAELTWLQFPILQRTHGRSTLHVLTVGGRGSWIQRSAVTGTLSTAEIRCLHSTVRVCWPRSQLVEHSLHSVISQLTNTYTQQSDLNLMTRHVAWGVWGSPPVSFLTPEFPCTPQKLWARLPTIHLLETGVVNFCVANNCWLT